MIRATLTLFLLLVYLAQPARAEQHNFYQVYKKLLSEYVQKVGPRSSVNYSGLRANPNRLNSFLKQIEQLRLKEYQSFSKNEKLAFLINSYNALTLKLVVDNYPLKSIKDISESPWNDKFFRLLEKERSLDELEHQLIRKNFKEPRIHFALVCAAVSCPALQPEPYYPDSLEEQLDRATTEFLKDSGRNSFGKEEIRLSKIFEWFADDFGGQVKEFALRYSGLNPANFDKTPISYFEYDWALND